MRWICALLLLTLIPNMAQAGAWARGKGNLYLSFSAQQNAQGARSRPELSLFAEYGATDWLSLGAKLFDGTTGQTDEAVAFATVHFAQNRPVKLALSLGGGLDKPDGAYERATALVGAHLGYGLPRGWIALDGYAQISVDITPPWIFPNPDYKADLTIGHRLTDRLTLIGQIQSGAPEGGQPYAKFAPSIGWRWGKADIALGAVYGLRNDNTRAAFLRSSLQF